MTTTFLATLMWRGLVNSVALAPTTYRKMGRMSDRTGTQVKVQMINKCKALMTSRGLHKKGSPHEEGIGKIEKEYCSNQNYTYIQLLLICMTKYLLG